MKAETESGTTIGFDEDLGRLLRAQGKSLRDLTRSRAKKVPEAPPLPDNDDCGDDKEPKVIEHARIPRRRR